MDHPWVEFTANDGLRGHGYAEVRPRRAAASPSHRSLVAVHMLRLGKGRLRCCAFEMMGCCATLLNFHASTQIPQLTQTHTYVHTMYKANQPGIRFRHFRVPHSLPSVHCHMCYIVRAQSNIGRESDQTDLRRRFSIFVMKFRRTNELCRCSLGQLRPRFLLGSVRVV